MQIVCPNCKTAYQIADLAVGAAGRQVRCKRCENAWHVEPPPEPVMAAATDEAPAFGAELGQGYPPEAPAADSAPPPPPHDQTADDSLDDLIAVSTSDSDAGQDPEQQAPVALSDIPIPLERGPAEAGAAALSPAIDNIRPDIESVAARRARTVPRKSRSRARVPLVAAIAVLLVASVSLLSFRAAVVRHAPQLASLYSALRLPVNLRGLAFTDLKIGNEIHDGVPVLVVEGMIVSTTSKTVDVPRLRFALLSVSGAEVYSWTAPPSQPTLSAFEGLPFRSRLASPPAEGHDIQVRFFNNRRDAVASLR